MFGEKMRPLVKNVDFTDATLSILLHKKFEKVITDRIYGNVMYPKYTGMSLSQLHLSICSGARTVQCPVPSVQCPVPSVQCPVSSAQCPVYTSVRCSVSSVQCPVSSAQCPVPSVYRRHDKIFAYHCTIETLLEKE